MIPSVIIYYVRGESERRPGEKIAKAAFVNAGDALTFWQALPDTRRRYLLVETLDGEAVAEIGHTGLNESYGYYAHAQALVGGQLPPRTRNREDALKRAWEFERILPPDREE